MSDIDTKALRERVARLNIKLRDRHPVMQSIPARSDDFDIVLADCQLALRELDALRAAAQGHADIVANLRGNLLAVQEECMKLATDLETAKERCEGLERQLGQRLYEMDPKTGKVSVLQCENCGQREAENAVLHAVLEKVEKLMLMMEAPDA